MKRRYDLPLLFVTLTLLAFGLAMVYSASAFVASEMYGNPLHHVTRQGLAAGIGLVAMAVFARLPYKRLRAWAPVLMAASVFALALVWMPGLGHKAKGAARWFGFGGLNIQPVEGFKVVVLICLATLLHRHRDDIHRGRVFALAAAILSPLLMVILQPDFGSTMIICVLAATMFFFAGLRMRWILTLGAVATPILGVVMLAEEYRVKRVMSFLHPFQECSGDGYQVCQSLLALHHGGLIGQGPGESSAKLLYLPEPYNDFIAAVLGEELGLWGMGLLLILFGYFAARGFSIARRAADPFGALLASTFTVMIVGQACLNLGVVLSIVPPKGLVLPFISYGASAMIVNLAAVGILLSISAEAREVDPAHVPSPTNPQPLHRSSVAASARVGA